VGVREELARNDEKLQGGKTGSVEEGSNLLGTCPVRDGSKRRIGLL